MDNSKPDRTINELITEKLKDSLNAVLARVKQEISASIEQVANIDVTLSEDDIALFMPVQADALPVVAPTVSGTDVTDLLNAVRAVEAGRSQVEVLTPLLENASKFADRVAIFILKQDLAIGWKAIGFTGKSRFSDADISSTKISLAEDNVISKAKNGPCVYCGDVENLPGNAVFTSKLGSPGIVAAVPLVTKNKITAVLYADNGLAGGKLEIEKLEILVRVAGMAVDLVNVRPKEVLEVFLVNETGADSGDYEAQSEIAGQEFDSSEPEDADDTGEFAEAEEPVENVEDVPEKADEINAEETISYQAEEAQEAENDEPYEVEEVTEDEDVESYEAEDVTEVEIEPEELEEISETDEEPQEIEMEPVYEMEGEEISMEETAEIEIEPSEETDEFAVVQSEPVFEMESPTEVTAEETTEIPVAGIHDQPKDENTEAKRFARLLVSEILLYNEKKLPAAVKGKKVYSVLKDDIDRSFRMYQERITPEVAKQHDFFYKELVKTLAGGDASALAGYPFEGEG